MSVVIEQDTRAHKPQLDQGALRDLSEDGLGYIRMPAREGDDNGSPQILPHLALELEIPLASIPYGEKGFFVFDPERIKDVTTKKIPFKELPIIVAGLEEGMSVYHGDDSKQHGPYIDGELLRGLSCNIVCFREITPEDR